MKVATKVARKVSGKVARKTPAARQTLTLSADAYRQIEALRGSEARSAFVERLLEKERRRREREEFIESVNAACTPEFCRETLKINAEFPIHDE